MAVALVSGLLSYAKFMRSRIRYELVAFVKAINSKKDLSNIRQSVSETVCEVVEDFYGRKEMMLL